jgi:hypothetical protein
MYALCQRPNSAGRSRQGAPVRMTHNTASTNRRLSFAVTPRSAAFPGSSGASRTHCPSLNRFRTIRRPLCIDRRPVYTLSSTSTSP